MQRDDEAFYDKIQKVKMVGLQEIDTESIVSALANLIKDAARMSQAYKFNSYIEEREPNKTSEISTYLAYAILMMDELERRRVIVDMKLEQTKLYNDVNGISKNENEDIGYNAVFYSELLVRKNECIDFILKGTFKFNSFSDYIAKQQNGKKMFELIANNGLPAPADMKACLRMIKLPLPLNYHLSSTSVIQAVVIQDPPPLPPRAKHNDVDENKGVKATHAAETMQKITKYQNKDILQKKPIDTLREEIRQQIIRIKKDGNYKGGMYAIGFEDDTSRYQHKLNVLNGVLKYIEGKINIKALNTIIDANPKYDKSLRIGRSKTGKILDKALEYYPSNENDNKSNIKAPKERRPRKSR